MAKNLVFIKTLVHKHPNRLSKYPDVGLSEARRKHQDARKLVALGIHPTEDRKRRETELKIAGLKPSCMHYLARMNGSLRPASIAQREREINKHLMPKLGDRLMANVTRLDLQLGRIAPRLVHFGIRNNWGTPN
jgi:hypothetical protein